MSAAAFMQLSAYAPLMITGSGHFAALVRHTLIFHQMREHGLRNLSCAKELNLADNGALRRRQRRPGYQYYAASKRDWPARSVRLRERGTFGRSPACLVVGVSLTADINHMKVEHPWRPSRRRGNGHQRWDRRRHDPMDRSGPGNEPGKTVDRPGVRRGWSFTAWERQTNQVGAR